MINFENIVKVAHGWKDSKPFPHIIVDDFLIIILQKNLKENFQDFTTIFGMNTEMLWK